jgi:cell wall-associated protease
MIDSFRIPRVYFTDEFRYKEFFMIFKQSILVLSLSLFFFSAYAANPLVAVIDSGTDIEHVEFVNNVWLNPGETLNNRDDDGNGYPDDLWGWNFAENNNLVIDRKYIGTFSDRPRRFFDIQGRAFLGLASEEEIQWLRDQFEDPTFLKEMQIFGNFIHGTHVAGIAAQDSDHKILSVKLIPTEVKPFLEKEISSFNLSQNSSNKNIIYNARMRLVKSALGRLAGEQMKMLTDIADYIHGHGARVANGSFGTGFSQAEMIGELIFRGIFFRAPKDEERYEVALHFMNALLEEGKKFVAAAPKTLFVFASGNDGKNNDQYPGSPTNIAADNVISVGATYQDLILAPFSNFGTSTVDVAAPGMIVDSLIPGNERLAISGTSQAAPFVANVAAKILAINPRLNPGEVKAILMRTVDEKTFLTDKIKSRGMVNALRAEVAAQMSVEMSLDQAVVQSFDVVKKVAPASSLKSLRQLNLEFARAIPMPAQFQ